MGTSKSYTTPAGGGWTEAKRLISSRIKNRPNISASAIAGSVVRAAGGFGSPAGSSGGSTSSSGGSGGVSRAVAGLAGFGAGVQTAGLGSTLAQFGLESLVGRPAAEVIAAISERLSEAVDGLDAEILKEALRDALLEIAALDADAGYTDLEAALERFLQDRGILGLVEAFLSHYVFSQVWTLIEQHVQHRVAVVSEAAALASAVEAACADNVKVALQEAQDSQDFPGVDWFGPDGKAFADRIVKDLETRIRQL
jgi:hypothetical protein